MKRLSLGQATFSSVENLAMCVQLTVFPASVSAQESETTMPFWRLLLWTFLSTYEEQSAEGQSQNQPAECLGLPYLMTTLFISAAVEVL